MKPEHVLMRILQYLCESKRVKIQEPSGMAQINEPRAYFIATSTTPTAPTIARPNSTPDIVRDMGFLLSSLIPLNLAECVTSLFSRIRLLWRVFGEAGTEVNFADPAH
jgi:hypothetical protein